MSDINPSLVSSELTTIETFKDTTEKRGSKLTLNELNYISDKQLHQKTDGEGGGSSPVGLAKVKFVADDSSKTLDSYFYISEGLPVYLSGGENYTETSGVCHTHTSIGQWNDGVDGGHIFLIIPCVLYKLDATFTYTLEGAAEFGHDDDSNYIKITGDCTITIKDNSSLHK